MIPKTFRICLDDYHARHVGRTRDGRQFFVTTPFLSKTSGDERNFVATFLFDDEGRLLDDRIDEVGPRPDGRVPPGNIDYDLVAERLAGHVAALGDVVYGDIEVSPFRIMRFGIEFGLIPHEDEEDSGQDCIEMRPGDYMAFYAPWSGDYDT